MKKTLLFALALLIMAAVGVPSYGQTVQYGATLGTVTLTKYENSDNYRAYHLAWVCDATGRVTGNLTNIYGTIERVAFAPVAAASPTADYDVALKDVAGVDVLQGIGTNCSATVAADNVPIIATAISSATTHHTPSVAGTLALSITAAGVTKQGLLTIFVKQN